MKLVIRTVIFHFTCILIFSYLYYYISYNFQTDKESEKKKYTTFLDFFLLSTTIQAGVGISDIYPVHFYGKLAIIIQQFIMILSNVITLYIFTL
jgi:hypothetical protein